MSKVIKVEDPIYDELDHLRMGRQTFSDVIKELLDARLKVLELLSALEGSLKYREWQREKLDIVHQASLDRADLESRRLK